MLKHIFKFKYLKNTGLWIVVEHSPLKQLVLVFRKIPFAFLWEPSLPSCGPQERQVGLNLPVFLCSKAELLPRARPELCTEADFHPGSFLSSCSLDFGPARLHFLLSPQMPPAPVFASLLPPFLLSCGSELSRAVPSHLLCRSSLSSYIVGRAGWFFLSLSC